MIARTTIVFLLLCGALSAAEDSWVVSARGMSVPFNSWRADGSKTEAGVLVLVPGYNGSGSQMFDSRWKKFAEKNELALLAPTFHAEGKENNEGRGYYYPEQGSGEVMEKALAELKRRSGVNTDRVLMFGFSAGAHFSHRFALWKPERVKVFVAYSAGWWAESTARVRNVPALILCGETDERYGATWEFFKKGQRFGCPWVWRSYAGTGHVLTTSVRNMAEAFLSHYAKANPCGKEALLFGDVQTFKVVGPAKKETISEEYRIELPSTSVAEVWEKEGE